ncbi:hypothetical protein KIN20_029777 [Parelaphostrongylus tenuis]|uniref:Uncharacterized protein n=1 Tax=Parelaphostrongylus tenuis TaxID=148309 RepID=A0AAD5R2X5_PARTN|nr:hypothetical protein KIN20_029777 [Parelaphostrongylus tenuis]
MEAKWWRTVRSAERSADFNMRMTRHVLSGINNLAHTVHRQGAPRRRAHGTR